MYAIYGNIYHQYTPNVSIYIYTSTMDPSWDKPTHPTRGQLQVSSLGTSKDGHEAGRESIGTLGAVAAM